MRDTNVDLRRLAEVLSVGWSDPNDILKQAEKFARYTIIVLVLSQKNDPERMADARALRHTCRQARTALRDGNVKATARWAFTAGQQSLVLATRDLVTFAEVGRRIKERQNKGGRPPKLSEGQQADVVKRIEGLMADNPDRPQKDIYEDVAAKYGVDPSTTPLW